MKGNGNSFKTLFQTLYFFLLPTYGMRTKYIIKNKKEFFHIGTNLFFQPRKFPSDPELISIGDNVKIASGVTFVNHDICNFMLNTKFNVKTFNNYSAPIKIRNNVMIGANTMIMPSVEICDDVIIAAGTIVSKNINQSSVYGRGTSKTYKIHRRIY